MATQEFQPSQSAPLQTTPKWKGIGDRHWEANKLESEALYNQALNNWQYQNYVDLLNYQNAYNSPLEQMARYKEAGINANLAAGQISGGEMSAGSAPSAQGSASGQISSHTPTTLEAIKAVAEMAQLGMNMAGQYYDFGRTRADISHTNALAENVRWNTKRSQGLYEWDLLSSELGARKLYEEGKALALENATFYDKLAMAQKLNDAQCERMYAEIRRSDELLPHEKNLMIENLKKIKQEADNLKKQGVILDIDADIRKEDLNIRKKDNMTYNARAAADIASKMGSGKPAELAAKLVYGSMFRTEFAGKTAANGLMQYVKDNHADINSAVDKTVGTLGKLINSAVDTYSKVDDKRKKYVGQAYKRVRSWAKESYNPRFTPVMY